jgi:two-component system response regulator DesR
VTEQVVAAPPAAAPSATATLARDEHERLVQSLLAVGAALSGPEPLSDAARRRCAVTVQGAAQALRDSLRPSPAAPATRPAADPAGVRILVVDDHDLVQLGLRLVLSKQAWVNRCVPASTGAEAEDRARRYEPHVAVIGVAVGGEAGVDIAQRVTAAHGAARVLLMGDAGTVPSAAARRVGAAGFITRDLAAAQIAAAVRRVARGDDVFDAAASSPVERLSPREREVLTLVAAGLTNAEIAGRLGLSPNTVKEHASSMFRTLGARNRADAVQRAQRLGALA